MFGRALFGVVVLVLAAVNPGHGDGPDRLKGYFSDTASRVKATTEAAQKREILAGSLQTVVSALDRVDRAGLASQADRAGLDHFRKALTEKQDELAGRNGFAPVADGQLDAFSDYVVQDMEQAAETITISLVSALLVIIILILIA